MNETTDTTSAAAEEAAAAETSETKVYADDQDSAADVEQSTAETVPRTTEVTGAGYVLNLADIENIARITHDASRDKTLAPPFDELDEHVRNELVHQMEDAFDGKPGAMALDQTAVGIADAIKHACDNLIADYLREPIKPATEHNKPGKPTGPRTLEEARALPVMGALMHASNRMLDVEDGGIVAFRDEDGTIRRVWIIEDGTLAKY
jgi:hypothetical protein